ncbi:MAG: hypothetical protein Q9174_006242, partial [Haloplaca sp. 1 TL-2023]
STIVYIETPQGAHNISPTSQSTTVMPRTFKFSFPLPRRKASEEKNSSPGAANASNEGHDHSPFSDPGSKAERVLGTMQPTPPDLSSKASRKAMRKKPSFMSVTISEPGSDSAAAKEAARDGFPFPGMPSSRESSRRPSHTLRNQPSSPLLGDRFIKDSPGTDSMTDHSSPRPHFYGSSSTLRSYYDPVRSPLSISQQTSASSARDMALRKGHPSISSPLSQDVSDDISLPIADNLRRPATDETSGRRPKHMDLSGIYTQSQPSIVPMLSPDQVSKSPSQLSYSSSPHSTSAGQPSWWKRRKARESKSKKESTTPSEFPRFDDGSFGVESLKTNIKKPKAGMQHWFDSTDDRVNVDPKDDHLDTDKAHGQFWNKRLNTLQHETQELLNEEPKPKDQSGLTLSERRHTNELTSPIPDSVQPGLPTSHEIDTPAHHRRQRPRSKSLTSPKPDRLDQSFLELSSSSDDECESRAVAPQTYRRHRIRDSIDQNDMGDDVLVTSAERVRPVKPKPVVNTSPRRSKRESEVIPPVPKIPERPQLQQRVSSIKWRESTSVKSPPLVASSIRSTTSSNADSSMAYQSPGPRSTPADKKASHGSRLMTVTAEEGELLDAMRKKRASSRPDPFSPGYVRPKTAGTADGGRTSYFGSDFSPSPPPSLPTIPDHNHNNPYSIDNGPHSPFQFPEVPLDNPPRRTPRQAPPIIFPPPKASPTE